MARAKTKTKAKTKKSGKVLFATRSLVARGDDVSDDDVPSYVALMAMTVDEIEAFGPARFDRLLERAEVEEKRRSSAETEALVAAVERCIDAGRKEAAVKLVRDEVEGLRDEVVRQRCIAKKFARMVFGSRSEKLDPAETKQFCLAFGMTEEEFNKALAEGNEPSLPVPLAPADAEPSTDEPAHDAPVHKGKSKHRGRRPLQLAANVKIIESDVIPVAPEDRVCAHCSTEMKVIRIARHERMELRPASLECHVERREVCACTHCRKDAVTADTPDEDRTTRRVGTSVVAHLIAEKCNEAQPLHRETMRIRRLGWNVASSTLESAFIWGAALLGPVADATRGHVLAANYICADSTVLKVLAPSRDAGIFRGQVWTFASANGVAFEFTPSWKAEDIAASFAVNWGGFKQVDDYKGYASKVTLNEVTQQLVPDELRLGCMMHVRRKFHEAFELKDARASEPIHVIRELYRIEAEAKAAALSFDARHALRQEQSLPLLARLKIFVDAYAAGESPKSLLGIAARYALAQWAFVTRCFSRGEFEIDNGAVEREIRAIAIGRRNFHFTGSIDAAKRLCDAYTLVANAKRLGLDPFCYLNDILRRLERGFVIRDVAQLTPHAYAANKAAQ